MEHPPVVVRPMEHGVRPVMIHGHDVGHARRLADVAEFLRRAGLENSDPQDPTLVEWWGGGPEVWPA